MTGKLEVHLPSARSPVPAFHWATLISLPNAFMATHRSNWLSLSPQRTKPVSSLPLPSAMVTRSPVARSLGCTVLAGLRMGCLLFGPLVNHQVSESRSEDDTRSE